jgi:drug/metabolite transporter (DMT)-like permease
MRLRAGLSPIAGLLALSALWAFGWLLADLFPHSAANMMPQPLGQAILFGIFAAMTCLIAAVRRLKIPRGRHAWQCAGVGIGLFVIPTAVAALAQNWISNFDEVAALCLTAVFAVVLEPFLQEGVQTRSRAAMAGALAAIAGVLCLFPLEIPRSFQAGAGLGALIATAFEVAATNCIAVRLARENPGRSILPMATLAGGASAVCFAVMAVFSGSAAWHSTTLHIYASRLLLVDIPSLFLLFWLLSHMGASQMTARFLLAPLFAALAGLVLEQRLPPLRAFLGMALLAGGSGWLVFAPAEPAVEERLSLRVVPAESLGSSSEE